MNSEDKIALEKIIILREQGFLQDVINKLNNIIRLHPNDGIVLVEALKLSLLHQKNEHAYNIYLALKQIPDGNSFLEPEFLTRLQICTNHQLPELELFDNTKASKWVSLYRTDGIDPLYPAKITDWSVTCNQGPVSYNFIGQCPSCNSTYHFEVHMTLLVDREYLCPVCLARQTVDYEDIKMAIEKKLAKSKYTNQEKYRLDKTLHEMRIQLNSDAMDGDNFPLICRHLNIDYLYMVNQFIIGGLFPHEEKQ